MSDDQLSWDKIFGENASQTEAKPAPSPVPNRTAAKEKSSRASVSSADPVQTEKEKPLSSLNWGPLTSSTAQTVTQPVTQPVTPNGTANVATTTLKPLIPTLNPKMTSVPVARDILPPDTDEESDELAVADEEARVLSVFELNKQIRSTLEGQFPLVWVKGEISNFKAHTSGHFYFSLKDAKAQVSAVMFRGFNQQLKFRPADGMEVLVRGRVTVYEPRGNYQMFCEMMEPVGAGALQKAFEQLKSKLQAEGLFDPARKRPLPALPKHIAIVTSPTGAAIRDMLNVLGRRFKGLRITVVPTKVQGEQAAGEIVAAIELVKRLSDVDVMIVGRGGGSIEDMWCFNDERVARAIAATHVPVISAVGHEIDFTIADFVADLRAPTPSAAAELVVKNASDLQSRIEALTRSLKLTVSRALEFSKKSADSLAKRLVDPQRRIQDSMLRSDELTQRLEAALLRRFSTRRMGLALLREKLGNPETRILSERQKIESLAQRLSTGVRTLHERKAQFVSSQMALLDSLSPLRVVERGYSLVTLNQQVVTSVDQIHEGAVVCLQFAHGRASAEIRQIENTKGVTDRE
ncbi:MAG: exodeoxyribonuclease VII large subunit [Bdellovibrionaceae bacterium]|nr:exodeoxyribonuclease VII large subunit [Pseudobdellovibrionaceae bacterium]